VDRHAGRRFEVRVEGVQFDAAHFATFGRDCEPLHGHTYQVAAEVAGPLSDEAWVVDFVALKSILRGISRELDHRSMLQLDSRLLHIVEETGGWSVGTPSGKQYTFPRGDVAALPIDNTTAERLAEWFASRVTRALAEKGAHNVETITVEVWEGPGQRAATRQESLPVE
jgi:6-pyruvoyltetrahydropterin/6-carboxytetrahydropterin synthase